ncbi:MAG: type IV toxin-antitoxin system AbiEi family antitoxin domain-containing protein [Actinomycetota bacterium]|nr:type IV toxin-antitoxin system AbiEi family antitoxin domain-containing protein [Actinomycetota bacterium]
MVAGLAAAQHGAFHRHQVLAVGFTPRMIQRRLESGLWVTVHPGVYRVASAPPSWEQRLMAACLAGEPTAVASHRAAGALWTLHGLERGRIEITVADTKRSRLRGVLLHRTLALPRSAVTTAKGIPVTRPARTLIDLAAVLDGDCLEEALDSALRQGLTFVRHLRRCLETLGSSGRLSTETLGALLEARAGGRPSENPKELEMARMFVAAGLPSPELQYELHDRDRFIARFDCAYPPGRIAAEYNSYQHHHGRQAWDRDQTRDNRATAHDWLIFGFTDADLHDPQRTEVENLRRAYDARARG